MLKLVFHTASFGDFNFEYNKPCIRVGRNPDNDLVLPHESVKPYHCLLLFHEDAIVMLAADVPVAPQLDLHSITGPTFHSGDRLCFGEIEMSVEDSRTKIAIPGLSRIAGQNASASGPGVPSVDSSSTPEPEPAGPQYYCPQCNALFVDAKVTRIGLVGRAKHLLCPTCSHPVDLFQAAVAPSNSVWQKIKQLAARLWKELFGRRK
jgi:hypothetical protein